MPPEAARMRILYHHRTASRDGQAVHIEELIGALRELGHEVQVVGPDSDEGRGGDAMGQEVKWVQRLRHALPKPVYEVLELGYSLVSYARLLRAARTFRPDVIYERYNLYLLSGLMLKRRLGLPLLLEVNAPLAEERQRFGAGLGMPALARWAEQRVWRGADVVLPVTHVLKRQMRESGVPEARMVVIANGINEAHFAGALSPQAAKAALGKDWKHALVLGFTGFVRDWHGVDRVLHWMADGRAPVQTRLLVVGDGPARPDLEALATRLGISPCVRFTGVVPRDQVPAYVAAFDIALQPAVVPYASPLKLFEYLALGKAIVAPAQPNITEILTDGDNALLFDGAAPGGLEAALTRLCADAALREQLAAGAAASITRQGLTWRANAQRVVALAHAARNGQPLAEASLAAAQAK